MGMVEVTEGTEEKPAWQFSEPGEGFGTIEGRPSGSLVSALSSSKPSSIAVERSVVKSSS